MSVAEAQLPQLYVSRLLFCSCTPISLELRQQNPWPGQGAEAGTVASVLQSCCHAASFLWFWYVIDVFNKWTFASRIWDSSAILVEMPAHGRQKTIILRCCMLQCCLCLLIMSLPIQLQEKIHHNWSQVPPTSSNNGTQLSHPLPGSSWKRKTDKPWKKVCGKVQLHCTLSFQLFWTTTSTRQSSSPRLPQAMPRKLQFRGTLHERKKLGSRAGSV